MLKEGRNLRKDLQFYIVFILYLYNPILYNYIEKTDPIRQISKE